MANMFSNHVNRSYMSLDELKHELGYANDRWINIFFADWTSDTLLGLATFPWDKKVFTFQGMELYWCDLSIAL